MNLKKEILKIAEDIVPLKTEEVATKFRISRQYAASGLRELVRDGKLLRIGTTRGASYILPKNEHLIGFEFRRKFKNQNLKEHEVLNDIYRNVPFLSKLGENVKSIFDYAFLEMFNNAIEHSRSKYIEVSLRKKDHKFNFTVDDYGIGVFKNIMRERKLNSEIEAIQDLLKGKTTTQPRAHSGEGIFFTSKAGDTFVLDSFDFRLRVDNQIHDVFIEKLEEPKRGTRVSVTIDEKSKKHLNTIFKKFQANPEEYAFDKTEVKIHLYTLGTIYISRSQARRVLSDLDRFRVIILDFDRVPTIGQAFADEVFRVFSINHPDIEIKYINANEAVRFMIERVDKEGQNRLPI